MRFKELEMRLITLEFTGDGRFAYCERGMSTDPIQIYEGVLMKPTGTSMRLTVDSPEEDELEQQDTSGPSTEAGDCAIIEGRAIVRYERGEVDGHAYLMSVERGEFRFAITVKPCFKSTEMEAWVQPLFMSLGQRQTRKHLALVDVSGNFLGEAFGQRNLAQIPSRPNSRMGFSTGLHLERAAIPRNHNPTRNRPPAGFDGHLNVTFPMPGQRSRPMKKLGQGSNHPLCDSRTLDFRNL